MNINVESFGSKVLKRVVLGGVTFLGTAAIILVLSSGLPSNSKEVHAAEVVTPNAIPVVTLGNAEDVLQSLDDIMVEEKLHEEFPNVPVEQFAVFIDEATRTEDLVCAPATITGSTVALEIIYNASTKELQINNVGSTQGEDMNHGLICDKELSMQELYCISTYIDTFDDTLNAYTVIKVSDDYFEIYNTRTQEKHVMEIKG